jgi:hypothetical protein
MSQDAPVQQFHFSCSKAVLNRLPMERIEMIYMIAFRSMIKELREGQTPRPYAMLFRSRAAAVMDIRINRGWLIELDSFWGLLKSDFAKSLSDFYQSFLADGDEYGVSTFLADDFDITQAMKALEEE